MHSVDLEWKEFSVNLDVVDAWLKANAATNYLGMVAGALLSIYYSEKPADETIQAINDYWTGLTEESDEATSYIPESTIQEAIAAARVDAVSKTWDELSTAQRKLALGLTPTREDLGV